MVPNILLQISVQLLHNSMVSWPEEVGTKYAKDEENIFIISDSTIRNIIPPQLKNISTQYKVMCGCECCIYSKSMH